MKKTIATLLFVFAPFIVSAETAQQQYESALRQVIVLLQQQVALLIEQLNQVNAQQVKINPEYTYLPIVTAPIIVPELPQPTVTPTQPTPVIIAGSTPAPTTPEYEYATLSESENIATYNYINRSNKQIRYDSVTLKITPKTIANEHVVIEVNANGNITLQVKPTEATTITVPFTTTIAPLTTTNLSFEVKADGVSNPNDRYLIELVSLNSISFGSNEITRNNGVKIYAF
jgi:hypothetical protein